LLLPDSSSPHTQASGARGGVAYTPWTDRICLLFLQIFSSARSRVGSYASPKQGFLPPNDSTCASTVDILHSLPNGINQQEQPWCLFFQMRISWRGVAVQTHSLSVLPIRCDKIATFAETTTSKQGPTSITWEAIRKALGEPLTHADQPVRAVASSSEGKQCCHRDQLAACTLVDP
jgi:hypothetical protein